MLCSDVKMKKMFDEGHNTSCGLGCEALSHTRKNHVCGSVKWACLCECGVLGSAIGFLSQVPVHVLSKRPQDAEVVHVFVEECPCSPRGEYFALFHVYGSRDDAAARVLDNFSTLESLRGLDRFLHHVLADKEAPCVPHRTAAEAPAHGSSRTGPRPLHRALQVGRRRSCTVLSSCTCGRRHSRPTGPDAVEVTHAVNDVVQCHLETAEAL